MFFLWDFGTAESPIWDFCSFDVQVRCALRRIFAALEGQHDRSEPGGHLPDMPFMIAFVLLPADPGEPAGEANAAGLDRARGHALISCSESFIVNARDRSGLCLRRVLQRDDLGGGRVWCDRSDPGPSVGHTLIPFLRAWAMSFAPAASATSAPSS